MSARRRAFRALAHLRDFLLPGVARRRGAPLFGDGEMLPVKATCSTCGDVYVPFENVRLIAYVSGEEYIDFQCPSCNQHGMALLPRAFSYAAHKAGFPIVKMPDANASMAAPIDEDEFIEFGRRLHSADDQMAAECL